MPGPSVKMTTLYHSRCPIEKLLHRDPTCNYIGTIVNGVAENYTRKIKNAHTTAALVERLNCDGALVVVDSWGNHHIDFINIIDQLGRRGIPSVGVSFIGTQGELVIDSPYADVIIDLDKTEDGVESTIVGQNTVTDYDAIHAIYALKQKLAMQPSPRPMHSPYWQFLEQSPPLEIIDHPIDHVQWADYTAIEGSSLFIDRLALSEPQKDRCYRYFEQIKVQIIAPHQQEVFVNTILDVCPIATKISGDLGIGKTHRLDGVVVLSTGVEAQTGYQPANQGSSEGHLSQQMQFNLAATPASSDLIIHLDYTFKAGYAQSWQAIKEAHDITDQFVDQIRQAMQSDSMMSTTAKLPTQIYTPTIDPELSKIVVIKVCSARGFMYDTALWPDQPGGSIGACMLRSFDLQSQLLTPGQCFDGAIHSYC